MADVIVVGGGVGGLTAAMLLAKDGHRVRLLERDPASPPADPAACWEDWERRGVNQFRLLHLFLPRWRQIIEAELPELLPELEAVGALSYNFVANVPVQVSGGFRPGDERFTLVTARRPVTEAVMARLAAATPGLEVCRGVAVKGLLVADRPRLPGVPHITGVETEDGRLLHADLVVDAGGRRSPLPRWLAALGARPDEELDECGFLYYGCHFRSSDGSVPPAFGPPLQPYDSLSLLALPADNGTWGVGITTSSRDRALRELRHVPCWEAAIRCYPATAGWIDAEPITGISVMAGIEDRRRELVIDSAPVVTGLVAVGDAWASTNPSLGRGASIGALHACVLRDVVAKEGTDDPDTLVLRFAAETAATVAPYLDSTLSFDRHRLAEIEADAAGVPYEPEDPAWAMTRALGAGARTDPVVARALAAIASAQALPAEVLGDPTVLGHAAAFLGRPHYAPGASRAELLAAVRGATGSR